MLFRSAQSKANITARVVNTTNAIFLTSIESDDNKLIAGDSEINSVDALDSLLMNYFQFGLPRYYRDF